MELRIEIFNGHGYRINQRFRKRIQGPLSYMINTLGFDCTLEKAKEKCYLESVLRGPNDKFCDFFSLFKIEKSKKKRKVKPKKKRHEEVEETV